MPKTSSQSIQSLIHKLQKPAEEKQTTPTVQMVIFAIDGQKYSVEITDLKEIIVASELTPLPNSPDYVKGIINLRGRIVAVIDLMKKIKLKEYEQPKQRNKILIFEIEEDLYGVEIDEVMAIETVEETAIKPAPEVILNKIHGEKAVKGVVMMGNQDELIVMFNLTHLITSK